MKLEFTDEMLNVIAEALMELPYKKSAPVIFEINRQMVEHKQQKEASNVN